MKHLIFLILIGCPALAAAQDSINPYNTQLPANIILQNTNVYYNPVDTPATYDTREGLSSQSDLLLDSNGVFDTWPGYEPETHGVHLKDYAPHGTPLGIAAHWQRFFTARDKPDGTHSDIIVGSNVTSDTAVTHGYGEVIISKNEDVDFRASGTIKMENGFHVRAGAFFHAYQEPRWGPTVLSDDFDSAKLNRAQWYLSSGANEDYGTESQCSDSSNVFDTLDPDAIDGHALDIIVQEDSCQCSDMLSNDEFDSCEGIVNPSDTVPYRATFSSADIHACPWPYQQRDTLPLVPAYQDAPYGKFEIREKIPHFMHHLNDWLFGSYEIDLNESTGPDPGWSYLFPNMHRDRRYGPFTGMFHKTWNGRDSVIFVSHEANWSPTNAPIAIYINDFPYGVRLNWPMNHFHDTIQKDPTYVNWPTSLTSDTTVSVAFYYSRYSNNQTDSITWHVRHDPDSAWSIFHAPYRIAGTDTFWFNKYYQPTSLFLTYDRARDQKWFTCHWDSSLNATLGDTGYLWLADTLSPTDLDSNKEEYKYNVNENPQVLSAMPFDLGDSTGGYVYHTFGVELLPHEMRFMMDSNVIYRYPDRMVPPGNPAFIPSFERRPLDLMIGEADLNAPTPHDIDSASFVYAAAHNWPGFRDVNGHPAAHRLIDYIRYWDVPADVKIPPFPR